MDKTAECESPWMTSSAARDVIPSVVVKKQKIKTATEVRRQLIRFRSFPPWSSNRNHRKQCTEVATYNPYSVERTISAVAYAVCSSTEAGMEEVGYQWLGICVHEHEQGNQGMDVAL